MVRDQFESFPWTGGTCTIRRLTAALITSAVGVAGQFTS